jgi:hypothetical protein
MWRSTATSFVGYRAPGSTDRFCWVRAELGAAPGSQSGPRHWIAQAALVIAALIWMVPDRRIENRLAMSSGLAIGPQ